MGTPTELELIQAQAALTRFVDDLSQLALGGRARTAMSIAESAEDPLWRALGTAAVYAILGNVTALEGAVQSAVALAPNTTLVLQTEGVLASLKGDMSLSVAKAKDALSATQGGDPSGRAQLGLARTMLLAGATDPALRAEGMELIQSMARFGQDPDAHLQLAVELGAEGVSDVFEHLAAAFVVRPRDPNAMRELMKVFKAQGWPVGAGLLARHVRETAATSETRLISHLIDLAVGIYLRGTSWSGLLPYTDADFASAIKASTEFSCQVQCTMASLLIDHARFEDANKLLTAASMTRSMSGDYAQHAFMLGRLQQAMGDLEVAAKSYAEAFDIDPTLLDAACNFADLSLAEPTPDALDAVGKVLLAIPIAARRNHLQLSYNEALWREARGEKGEALMVIDALIEGPLGALASHVGTLRARLLQGSATA